MSKERSTSFGFAVPPEMHSQLKEIAKREDLRISQIIRRAIREYLERHYKDDCPT